MQYNVLGGAVTGLAGTVTALAAKEGVQRDVTLSERVRETAEELDTIEYRVGELFNILYGPEGDAEKGAVAYHPSVFTQADRAYYTAHRIQRKLDEIFRRLAIAE